MTAAANTFEETRSEIARAIGTRGPVSFLSLALAGVQDQVKTARTTRDVWAGSALVSDLSVTACRAVLNAASLGWEAVLLPAIQDEPSRDDVSTFPNQVLLAIPGEVRIADQYGGRARDALRARWDVIVTECRSKFPLRSAFAESQWEYQTRPDRVFEFYWSAVELPRHDEEFWRIARSYHLIGPEREPSVFGMLLDWSGRMLGARKMTRTFQQVAQEGRRCSLCGERSALTSGDSYESLKNYWESVRNDKKSKLKYRFRPQERLCAVCTVRRMAPVFSGLRPWDREEIQFPSTSSFAVARSLASDVSGNPERVELADRLARAIEGLEGGESRPDLPYFNKRGLLIAQRDGDWLFDSFYDGEPERQDSEARRLLRQLLTTGFQPGIYYVVIMADGDKMGEWIAGRMIGERFTPRWQKRLSRALADFSKRARPIVEEEVPGKLVYAGGDDVLAFVPVDDALEVIRNLWLAFRAAICEAFPDEFAGELAKLTLSFGCVIAKHNDPLTAVMDRARKNLKDAAKREYGRNAFAFERTTGGGIVTGMPFCEEGGLEPEWLDALIAVEKLMRRQVTHHEGLSGRIVSSLAEVQAGLADWKGGAGQLEKLEEAREACLLRAARRQMSGNDQARVHGATIVLELYRVLRKWEPRSPTTADPFERLIQLLALLRFITRPE